MIHREFAKSSVETKHVGPDSFQKVRGFNILFGAISTFEGRSSELADSLSDAYKEDAAISEYPWGAILTNQL
jgi:hypothetical protein